MKNPQKKTSVRFGPSVRFDLTVQTKKVSRRLQTGQERFSNPLPSPSMPRTGSSKPLGPVSLPNRLKSSPRSKPKMVKGFSGQARLPKSVGDPPGVSANGDNPPVKDRRRGGTAFQIYLKEVGTISLLTPDEEVELAARVQKGDDAARERMIKGNLRLVVKIARDFEGYGVPLLDLINEGNIGLMKAVERFDPEKGAKLSTYSSWWIKQSIKRALANQARDIRLPIHVQEKLMQIDRVVIQLKEALGRDPSHAEVAVEVDLPVHKVACYRDAAQRPASLDAVIQDGDGEINSLDTVIADEAMPTPFETLDRETIMRLMAKFLHELKPREMAILQQRFGLAGDSGDTLEAVGSRFEITREAVRQIQNRALEKLRKRFNELELTEAYA